MSYPNDFVSSLAGQSLPYKTDAPSSVFASIHDVFLRLSSLANYAENIEQKLNGAKPEDAQKGIKNIQDGIIPQLRDAAGTASFEVDRINMALKAIDKAISG